MRPRIRFRGPVGALGGYGLGLDMAPEKHYLQLNGTSDFGYAVGAATGVKDASGWTLVVKAVSRTPGNTKGIAQVYDDNATFPRNLVTAMYSGTTGSNRVWCDGYQSASTTLQFSLQPADQTTGGQQVFAATHADGVQADLYLIRGGSTLATAQDTTLPATRTPLHVGVGTLLAANHTSAGAYYGATALISVALVRDIATEADLQQYSLARDARDVWPSLWGYWPASAMYLDGATWKTRNLAGSVPITWSGPTGADLVRL